MSDEVYIRVRCMGHEPLELRRGDTVRIGRHHSNDLVLKEGAVSRFHASIVWDADHDRPYVLDNGSSNGVEVDGVFIDEQEFLTGDNTIGIGSATLVLQLKGRKPKPLRPRATREEQNERNTVRLFSERNEQIKGTFDRRGKLDRVLLQIEEEARTGTLVVNAQGRKGRITFSQGRVVTASLAGTNTLPQLDQELALREMHLASVGSYVFTRSLEVSEENLDLSPQAFLASELERTSSSDLRED